MTAATRRSLAALLVVVAAVSGAVPARADVPPLSAEARAAGFVDVRSVVPSAIIDLRYATANNFTGMPLYPPDARCLVHESLASGLAATRTCQNFTSMRYSSRAIRRLMYGLDWR